VLSLCKDTTLTTCLIYGVQSSFSFIRKCSRCGVVNTADLINIDYDHARHEYTLPNQLRPDIALLRNGELVCSIEIFVSHRCEAGKIGFHFKNKIPCVEVSADYVDKWNPEKFFTPLDAYGVEPWVCWPCEDKRNQPSAPAVDLSSKDEPSEPKWERRVLGTQKIFFELPPIGMHLDNPMTVQYVEVRLGKQSLSISMVIQGIPETVIFKVEPPYDREQIKADYEEYLGRLESDYGPIREGNWTTGKTEN
jgi:hypothetical protein